MRAREKQIPILAALLLMLVVGNVLASNTETGTFNLTSNVQFATLGLGRGAPTSNGTFGTSHAITTTSGTCYDWEEQATFADGGSSSSSSVYGLFINPTINFTAGTRTGNYSAIYVNVLETSLPTGTNYLLQMQAGAGGGVNKFCVDNSGNITVGAWQGTAVAATSGGTAQSTWTTGDILYASATNTLSKLPIGSSNKVLTVVSGIPAWATAASSAPTAGQGITVSGQAVTNLPFDQRLQSTPILAQQNSLTVKPLTVSPASASSMIGTTAFDGTSMWITDEKATGKVYRINATTGVVSNTVTVGSAPYGCCYDGTYVWAANRNDGTVSQITAATATVANTVTVGANPKNPCSDGTYIWVPNSGTNTVSQITVSTHTVANTVTVGNSPSSCCYDGTYVWVCNTGDASVSQITVSTHTVANTVTTGIVGANGCCYDGTYVWVQADHITAAILASTHTVAFSVVNPASFGGASFGGADEGGILFDGTSVWVEGTHGYIIVIDPISQTVTKNIGIVNGSVVSSTLGHALGYDGHRIWGATSTTVYAWNTESGSQSLITNPSVGTVPLLSQTIPNYLTNALSTGSTPIGCCYDGTNVWAANEGTNNATKVNALTRGVSATVSTGSLPYGCCYGGGYVWVGNVGASTVTQINAQTNGATHTITVGANPAFSCYDGTYVWVGNTGTNTVSQITVSTHTVANTVTVGNSPYGLCYDGSKVWVCNNADGTLKSITASSHTVTDTVTVGSGPFGCCFDGINVWVTNSSDNTVSKVSVIGSPTVLNTILVGSTPHGCCFDGTYVWVCCSGSSELYQINVNTGTVVNIVAILNPQCCCYDGTYVWVTSNNQVVAIPSPAGGQTIQPGPTTIRITGQTSSTASILVITAPAGIDTEYLVSCNINITSTAVGLGATVVYKDENGTSRTQTVPFVGTAGTITTSLTTTGAYEGVQFRIHVQAGQTATLATSESSGTYNLSGAFQPCPY